MAIEKEKALAHLKKSLAERMRPKKEVKREVKGAKKFIKDYNNLPPYKE
jgi:hypothetical protein